MAGLRCLEAMGDRRPRAPHGPGEQSTQCSARPVGCDRPVTRRDLGQVGRRVSALDLVPRQGMQGTPVVAQVALHIGQGLGFQAQCRVPIATALDHGPEREGCVGAGFCFVGPVHLPDARGARRDNPIVGTNRAVPERSREQVLSDAEVAAIWQACGDGDYGQFARPAAERTTRAWTLVGERTLPRPGCGPGLGTRGRSS